MNSPGWTRTSNLAVNSRSLYQLSYRGLECGCGPRIGPDAGEYTHLTPEASPQLDVRQEGSILWGSAPIVELKPLLQPRAPSPSDAHTKATHVMKNDIHPEYYPEAKVIYRGEEVMTVGATVPELKVEIWSGSHPFFTGKSSFVDTAGRVEKFQRKFQGDYFKKKDKKGK